MTSVTQMSKEYADALFSLAMDEKEEDAVLEALHLMSKGFEGDPYAISMLASPAIPKDERLQVLDKAFGDAIPEHVLSFAKVMCSRGHISCWFDCVKEYEQLYNAAQKLSTAYVRSAVELNEKQKNEIKNKLEKRLGRTICLECAVDASLLGGLVIQVDGKVIDGSLKHRLYEIKEVMNQ